MLAGPRATAALSPENEEIQGAGRSFRCGDAGLMRLYGAALTALRGNVVQLPSFAGSVLAEGSGYPGVWMECGPQEALVFGEWATEAARNVARNNHLIFFALQKDDGQLPAR